VQSWGEALQLKPHFTGYGFVPGGLGWWTVRVTLIKLGISCLQVFPVLPIERVTANYSPNDFSREIDLQVGLSTKLIGYVMAGVLITSAAIGVVRVQNERGPLSELIGKAGQSVANATASGAASLIAGYDYGNLEILADNVSRQANVIRVIVLNRSGRVMTQTSTVEARTYKRFKSPVIFNDQPIGSVTVDISTDALENALSELYWRVFVEQVIFGAILGLIVFLFTARGIVSPIRKLTMAMEEAVEKGGAFVARDLEVRSGDEIGRLVSVFNKLNKSLASYHHQLRSKIDFANKELLDKNIQLGGRTQELERALDLVNTMATTDWLTELPNRRKFDETLSRMFHQSERFAEEITLVLFDVDYFKQINDGHGHGAGDEVLRDLSTILRLHVRKSDLPARLGGDEFGVVLYHTNAKQAAAFVEKFMDGVRAYAFEYDGFHLDVGLSVGIAQYDVSMKAPQALYFAADKALYRAKHSGRNCYSVYSDSPRLQEKATS
jgi:diguanylate cyclase (GGDEF)-like protein